MKRGSTKFDTNIMANGEDASELRIENDRMKTTIMILSQKLKMKTDDGNEDLEKLQTEYNMLKDKNNTLTKINDDLE